MVTVIVHDNKGKEIQFEANSSDSLLEQALNAGARLSSSCHQGSCGSCKSIILRGREYIDYYKKGTPVIGVKKEDVIICLAGVLWQYVRAEASYVIEIAQQVNP